jgi:iron complex transport system permease protein
VGLLRWLRWRRGFPPVTVLLVVALLVGVLVGPAGLSLRGVLLELINALPGVSVHSGLSAEQHAILWQIRMPRVVLGAIVGAVLALSGATYQGVFRNPLADPYLLGVSSGAGLGATIGIIAGGATSFSIPLLAFAGGVLGVAAAYALGVTVGGRGSAAILLAGVAVAAFFGSAQSFVQQRYDNTLIAVFSWMLGRLSTAGWSDVTTILPYVAVAAVVILAHRRSLDVLALGDDEAASLGVTVGGRGSAAILLAGVAVAAFFSSAQSFVQQRFDNTLIAVFSWMLGRLSTAGWSDVTTILPYVAVAVIVILAHRRSLDVLALGDDEAASLGVNPDRTRLILVAAATLGTAAVVSVSGLIGFVGLVVPHTVRLLFGGSNRTLLPLSMLVGAAFLVLSDVLARTLIAPAELSVGIVTAFVGAPFFGFVLRYLRGSP